MSLSSWFRSWRLMSWRSAVVAALLLYTLVGFLVVPSIARRVITSVGEERLGRAISVESIACNPFNLSLTVEGFSLPDRPGTAMLAFDRLYANLQASSLLRRAITLKQLEVERPYIALRRFEDKSINVLELIDSFDSTADPGDAETERGLPRAIIEDISISDGRIEIENRAGVLMKEEWSPLDVELRHLSTIPNDSGDKEITLRLPEGGTLRLAGSIVVEPFGLEGSLSIDTIDIPGYWDILASRFEIDVEAGTAAVDLGYRVAMEEGKIQLEVQDADIAISGFRVDERDSGEEILRADSVQAANVDVWWPEQRIEAEALTIDGAAASAWLLADGTPAWESWVPEPTREEVVEAYKYVEQRVDIDASLDRFEVTNAAISFEDRTFDEPRRLAITNAQVSLTGVSSEPGSRWGMEAAASLAGDASASARGTFAAIPVGLDAEVELADLELSQFQPYVARFAPVEVKAGILSSTGKALLEPGDETPDIRFQGELSITGLNVDETVTQGPLLGWGDLEVIGIDAALAPTSLGVEKIDVFRAGLEISVDEQGKINLLEFFRALGDTEARADTSAGSEATDEGLPPARIRQLTLHDCYGLYKDTTTIRPFETRIGAVNGTITGIATDSATPAQLDIDAVVESGGGIRVAGRLDPFDYQRLSDLELDVREAHLPPMSPMSIKVVGFPIESGRATLDSGIEITDGQLVSGHHVEIDNLRFGDKVEGEGQINLPVKLGVSLLKDKNGRITLDVPIAGDLDDPEFVVSSAVAAATRDLVGEVAKSPFRMLARLGGGSPDQNLDVIDFEAGSAELSSSATASLDTLAKALDQRPELTLEIEGTFDAQADATGLRQAALAALFQGEPGATIATEELERHVRDQTSATVLEALRQEHTSAVEGAELEEPAYREALVAALVAAQPIDEGQIPGLGTARAEAIRDYLIERGGIEAPRITVLPQPVDVATGEDRVPSHLSIGTSG